MPPPITMPSISATVGLRKVWIRWLSAYSSLKKSSSVGSPASAACVEEADVAARAERAGALPCPCRAAPRVDLRVVAPGQQRRGQVADHVQRQRVERLRPVQRDEAGLAAYFRDDLAHALCFHPTSSFDHQRADHQRAARQHGLAWAPRPRRPRPAGCRRSPPATPAARSPAPSGRETMWRYYLFVQLGMLLDSDRHGIVTPDGGLMNPNHYLAVAIDYLYTAPAELARVDRRRQDRGEQLDHRPGGRRTRTQTGRGARRVQVVRRRIDRRHNRIRWGGERGRVVPAQRRVGVDHRQGRHHPGAAGLGDPRRHRVDPVAALRRARREVRGADLRPRRRARQPRAEGASGQAVAGAGERDRTGRRDDHREADHRARATEHRLAG